ATLSLPSALSRRLSLTLSWFLCAAPATTATYTLSLHDALPIYTTSPSPASCSSTESTSSTTTGGARTFARRTHAASSRCRPTAQDRKSTRLNSSHVKISYAVFCLKKKRLHHHTIPRLAHQYSAL